MSHCGWGHSRVAAQILGCVIVGTFAVTNQGALRKSHANGVMWGFFYIRRQKKPDHQGALHRSQGKTGEHLET